MESVAFFLPLMVTFALVAAVVLKKLLAGDPTLRSNGPPYFGQ